MKSFNSMFLLWAVTSVLQAGELAPPVASDHTVLLWNFAKFKDGEVQDDSAHQLNGTPFELGPGKIETGESGPFGPALRFGAETSRNFIKSDRAFEYFSGGSLAFEVWLKDPYMDGAEKTVGRLIAIQRTGSNGDKVGWSLGLIDGYLKFFSNSNSSETAFNKMILLPNIKSGVWYKLTFVAEASDRQARYFVYLQSNEESKAMMVENFMGPAIEMLGTGAFTVGADVAWPDEANRSFAGSMAAVMYSNAPSKVD